MRSMVRSTSSRMTSLDSSRGWGEAGSGAGRLGTARMLPGFGDGETSARPGACIGGGGGGKALRFMPIVLVGLGLSIPPRSAPAQVILPKPGTSAPSSQALELLSRLHGELELDARLGNLARERGRSAAVRRFGQLLARDASLLDRELVGATGAERLSLTPPAGARASQEDELVASLEAGSPDDLDRRLLDAVIERRGPLLTEARRLAPDLGTQRLTRTVGRILPIMNEHLGIAVGLRRELD